MIQPPLSAMFLLWAAAAPVAAAPTSAPAPTAPPPVPAPAEPPTSLVPDPPDSRGYDDPGAGETPTPPQLPDEPGPAGEPFDLLPIPPLSGLWGYGAEVVAAVGVTGLFGVVACVPLAGPVAYVVLAPPYVVEAVDHVASKYTETGQRNPDAALVVAYAVKGVNAFSMLAAQSVLLLQAAGVGMLLVADAQDNRDLLQLGGMAMLASSVGSLGLLLLLPATMAASLLGPHLEVLAYRYYDSSELQPLAEEGEGAEALPPPAPPPVEE